MAIPKKAIRKAVRETKLAMELRLLAKMNAQQIQIEGLRDRISDFDAQRDRDATSINEQRAHAKHWQKRYESAEMKLQELAGEVNCYRAALHKLYGFVTAGQKKPNKMIESWMARARGETYYSDGEPYP